MYAIEGSILYLWLMHKIPHTFWDILKNQMFALPIKKKSKLKNLTILTVLLCDVVVVGLSVDVVLTEDVWWLISLGLGFVVTFWVVLGAVSRQHFMDGDGQASSKTPSQIMLAIVWTQTPGQSLDSAVLVIVSNRPKHENKMKSDKPWILKKSKKDFEHKMWQSFSGSILWHIEVTEKNVNDKELS